MNEGNHDSELLPNEFQSGKSQILETHMCDSLKTCL